MAKTKAKVTSDRGGKSKGQMLAFAVLQAAKNGEAKSRSALMRDAGYSPATIHARQQRAWNSQAFKEAMVEAGLGVDSIRKVIDDAMKAREVVAFQGDARETDAPDHAIRLRATELAAKYTGLDVQRSQSININIDAQVDDAIDAFGL